jgi:hypothetical protein
MTSIRIHQSGISRYAIVDHDDAETSILMLDGETPEHAIARRIVECFESAATHSRRAMRLRAALYAAAQSCNEAVTVERRAMQEHYGK